MGDMSQLQGKTCVLTREKYVSTTGKNIFLHAKVRVPVPGKVSSKLEKLCVSTIEKYVSSFSNKFVLSAEKISFCQNKLCSC